MTDIANSKILPSDEKNMQYTKYFKIPYLFWFLNHSSGVGIVISTVTFPYPLPIPLISSSCSSCTICLLLLFISIALNQIFIYIDSPTVRIWAPWAFVPCAKDLPHNNHSINIYWVKMSFRDQKTEFCKEVHTCYVTILKCRLRSYN